MPSPLDPFMPEPEVRELFETRVAAPADRVMRAAYAIDLQSLSPIRAIIRLRKLLLQGSPDPQPRKPIGLVDEVRSLGWGTLVEEPGRLLVCGAVCRPWVGDVRFTPIPAAAFAAYADPDLVKIVWSLEASETQPGKTLFVHEVRAQATDASAAKKFKRYWRWARFGIVAIRRLLLPAIRRQAEHDAA